MKSQLLSLSLLLVSLGSPTPPPAPAWSVPCEVVEVYDGDTVVVEVTQRMRVRLLDCWASEIRTKDEGEKAKGMLARAALTNKALGRKGTLVIPLVSRDDDGVIDVGDSTTLGRMLGRVWLSDETEDLSTWMVKEGHAYKSKPEKGE